MDRLYVQQTWPPAPFIDLIDLIIDYVYRLLTKTNKLSFSVSVCSKQIEGCCFPFAENNVEVAIFCQFRFCIHIYIETAAYIYAAVLERKTEAQAILLDPLTICSSLKRKIKKKMEVIHLRTDFKD
jgi:hypothetical protein